MSLVFLIYNFVEFKSVSTFLQLIESIFTFTLLKQIHLKNLYLVDSYLF